MGGVRGRVGKSRVGEWGRGVVGGLRVGAGGLGGGSPSACEQPRAFPSRARGRPMEEEGKHGQFFFFTGQEWTFFF